MAESFRGSCHCGAVRFSYEGEAITRGLRCNCSICSMTSYLHLIVPKERFRLLEGDDDLTTYTFNTGVAQHHFCRHCGSALWAWDPRWPDLVHPAASAIDTDLPVPPERSHMMLGSKASWVPVTAGPDDRHFDEYPDESLAEWHRRLRLEHSDR